VGGLPDGGDDPKSGASNDAPAKREEPLTSDWLAQNALEYARRGDPPQLIARLLHTLQRGGEPLSRDEILFIIEALEATAGKEAKADLHRIDNDLMALRVEEFVLQKQAIGVVQDERRRPDGGKYSVRHIKSAIADYKRRRRGGAKTE
jgi:hypothetical protein